MEKSKVIRVVVSVLLGFSMLTLSGCALGDRKIALLYDTVVQVQTSESSTVAITVFQDLRENKDVGEVRNAYGMQTARVLAEGQDVGAWVANALSEELNKAGFVVEKFSDVIPPDYEIQIGGEVTEAYTKMYFNSTANITINVNILKSGVSVLSKEYHGKKSVPAILCSTGEYEAAMKGALQQLMITCVPDVVRAIE